MSEADTGQTKSSLKKLLLSQRNGIRPEHDDEVVSREDGRKSQVISSKDRLTASLTPSSPASIKETGDIKLDLDQNGKSLEAARSPNGRIQGATGPDDHNKVSLLLLKKRRSLQSRVSEESLRIKSLSTSRAGSNSIASKSANNVADRTHITEDKIKPLAAQAHKGASFGKVIASHSSFQSPPTANYNLNPILLIGLPLLGCLILALIIYLVARYRRRLKQKNADKCHGLNDVGGGSATKSRSPLTNFITNGNLLGASTKPNLIKRANELRQKNAPDCNQLTINMDGDCRSDQLAAEDSLDLKFKNFMRHKQTNNIKSLGSLRYRLSYDFNQSILSVSILEACDLPGMDLNGYSDPYVKVYLSPNKSLPAGASALQVDNQQTQKSDSICYRTRIHKRTLNPVFNETFKFHLAYAELANKTLIMSMYDFDRFSKHDDMGQVSIAMDQIDLAQGQDEWAELRKTNEQLEERLGDICLSLRYVPSSGKLNVVILQARQLKRMDVAGLSDPYVKLALMSDQGKRLKKKKTSIKKFTLNPHYNESFSFEIPFDQIQQVQLVVSVVDYDRIGTSEPIGKITLGCGQPEGSTELRHWMDMLASPRRPIAQWHTLKDINLDGRMSSSSGSIGSATS